MNREASIHLFFLVPEGENNEDFMQKTTAIISCEEAVAGGTTYQISFTDDCASKTKLLL